MSAPSILPVKSRIRSAAEYALRNRIAAGGPLVRYSDTGNATIRATGYHTTIGEVINNLRAPNSFVQYPGVHVYIDNEQCSDTGNTQIEQNTALISNSFSLVFECFLCDVNDPQLAAEKLLADIQTYFGCNYWIPDSTGAATCLTCYYESSKSGFMSNDRPNIFLEIRFRVWYRQRIDDPTRSS